nr:helicase [Tanacetum cinerariifolium]
MAKSFQMAKEWCRSHGDANFGLRLLSERTATRQYNAPTVSEVLALIINDFGDILPIRDIVVNKNNTGPQRISKLHPSYMALQYPLLFLFGEDGYHENIPYHTNKGIQKTKHDRATISIQENVKADANTASDQIMVVDEIKNYLNCQFLSPCKAVWRIFSFDINYAYPTVMQLNCHLPDQNAITLRDFEHLPALLERKGISITMFTE